MPLPDLARPDTGSGAGRANWTLVGLAFLVAVAALAVVVSRHTDPSRVAVSGGSTPAALPVGGTAPAVDAVGWLNSGPLGPADLAGKVVLYDFWTFDCINCQHTLPYVKAWHARYAADGLVLLSIHSPEFSFEADPANVAHYVQDHGITYPVALDPHHDVWRAFGNHYWPAFYLYDREGHQRYIHFGEGSYAQTEDVIRALLGVDPASPRAAVA